jgi:hypothetical protein
MNVRCLFMVAALLVCQAASAGALDIPAQKLDASMQALSKLSGVQITFAPDVVDVAKEHDAPALNGKYSLEGALDTLLAHTNLTYHVQDTATIEISALDEITITGRYEKLSAMKKEYEQLEDRFYDAYNKLNTNHLFDIECASEAPTGSHIMVRTCQPTFIERALEAETDAWLQGHAGPPAWATVQEMMPAYQENIRDKVKKNPKLLELLMKRNAAAERYAAARKKKFQGGKIFVWD